MKLHSILTIIDKKDQNKLKKYLLSPYFCTDPTLFQLLDVLIRYIEKSKEFENREIWEALYGKIPYQYVKLRLLYSRLFKLIEDFLKTQQNQLSEYNLEVLKIYRHHSKDKLFLQSLDEQKETLNKSLLRNEYYFDQQYAISMEEYDYLVTKKRQGDFNLKHISDSIEIAYAIKKLRHCCRVLQIHSINKIETPFPYIDEILLHIKLNSWDKIPVLGFYYYNYLSIIHPLESEYFNQCVSIYNENEDLFEEEERRYAFIDILNYCIRKLNEGSEKYYDIIFNLYNRGLKQGFLLDQGKLSRFTYRNIAEIGILMKEYAWVNQFLDSYKNTLEKQYRESFYLLEKARVLSDQRNYDRSIELLANLNFSDPLIELSTRLERIRIFYEMNALELCQYHVESMELFLRRKKYVGYHTSYYKNFLSYARKLLKPERTEIQHWRHLRNQLDKEDKITGRKWLIEKYDQKINQIFLSK